MNDDMLSPQPLSIEPLRRGRITAISSAVQRRPIVLVLGMHRSGTSLCSHILSALGVDMADKIPGPGNPSPTPDNPRGHWERWEIVEFHDRILGLFNRDYLGRFHDFALPVAWWADPRVAQIRREIVAFLEERMGDGYFGFKDPRTVRLMPVWHQIFNELKLAPKLVLCLRNPAQVARSLHARDGLDPANGEYRWLVHMIDFYRYASNFDCCTVEYEEWFDNPAANYRKITKISRFAVAAERIRSRSGAVGHHRSRLHGMTTPLIAKPASRWCAPCTSSPARPVRMPRRVTRSPISSRSSSASSSCKGPLLQAFEDVAEVAAKFPEIEQEAAALRAPVAERDTGLASAQLRADAAEARLADALAEIEGQRAQIAELARERDARAEIEREGERAEGDARRAGGGSRGTAERRLRGTRRRSGGDASRGRDAARGAGAGRARGAGSATPQRRAHRKRRSGRCATRWRRPSAKRSNVRPHAGVETEFARCAGGWHRPRARRTERAAAAAALQAEIVTLQDTLSCGSAGRKGRDRCVPYRHRGTDGTRRRRADGGGPLCVSSAPGRVSEASEWSGSRI